MAIILSAVDSSKAQEIALPRTNGGNEGLIGNESEAPDQATKLKSITYTTDDEGEQAVEKVIRLHDRLLAELAK